MTARSDISSGFSKSKKPSSNFYALRYRARLIAFLGGCCWACGLADDLEIDHPHGRDWSPREKSFSHRTSIYWREARENKVRLLCASCNGSKRFNGVELERPMKLDESQPF